MGSCFSAAKVSGSNSNSTTHTTRRGGKAAARNAAGGNRKERTRLDSNATTATTTTNRQDCQRNTIETATKQINQRPRTRRPGLVPCGKRTDFGYDKDFNRRYTIGKLLGHGQFGYTYVATDKASGQRVAVKKIDKNKMVLPIAVEDVKREVKILKELTGHENVGF